MKAPDGIYIFRELETLMRETEINIFDSSKVFQEKLLRILQREYAKILDSRNGALVTSSDNIKRMKEIRKAIDRVMRSKEYVDAVRQATASFSAVPSNLNNYFSLVDDSFSANAEFIRKELASARNIASNMLLGEGLNINFKPRLERIIIDGIENGTPISAVNDSLKDYLTKNNGGLARYSKQITTDTLNTFSRTYTNQVAEGLGLEHYFYSGTEIKTTRNFCEDRIGKYYTKVEIESWASKRWDGKKKGTTKDTIFNYLGGYGCRHKLVPVSERMYTQNR